MSRIPVIIPFYREHEKLTRCLAHVRAQTHPDIEVFVRDNSRDNVYFTAAVNEGLKRFSYDPAIQYVVILNQDAYLAPDAVRVLSTFLDGHPQSGIACPIQLTRDGQVSWGGSLRGFPSGVHRCDPLPSYTSPVDTYWANGAALMLRTQVVRDVGLWDPNLRFICSDIDFSFTARARGWRVHVVPGAQCEHTPSGSGNDAEPSLQLIKLRDAIYFSRKWLTGDLYRGLAFEGATLTAVGIRYEIDKLEKAAAKLEKMQIMPRGVRGP